MLCMTYNTQPYQFTSVSRFILTHDFFLDFLFRFHDKEEPNFMNQSKAQTQNFSTDYLLSALDRIVRKRKGNRERVKKKEEKKERKLNTMRPNQK